jgi:hypothetical protein
VVGVCVVGVGCVCCGCVCVCVVCVCVLCVCVGCVCVWCVCMCGVCVCGVCVWLCARVFGAHAVCVCVCACDQHISFISTFYVTVSTVFLYINGLKLHNKVETSLGRVRVGIEHKFI